jgi:hypothetical protein
VFGRETLEARSGPAFPGSEYLRRGTPRQVLAEIVEGDPLGMRGRCTERLCTRALLLSLDRLVLRSMARAARAAMTYRGRPQLARWLNAQIDAAIRDLIAEDRENERMGLLPGEPADPHYAFVSEALGVDPALARRVCVVHNDLPDLQRRVFWAVIVEGKSLHRCVAEGLGPHGRLREALADALRAVSRLRSVSRLDDHKQE